MALVQSNPTAETVGLAPKVAWITVALLALGIIIAVVDKLILGDDIEDGVWQAILATSVPAFLAGLAAPASVQRSKTTDSGTPARI